MPLLSIAGQKLFEIALEKGVDFILKLKNSDKNQHRKELKEGMSVHIVKAQTFCEHISIFKQPDTHETFSHSIELEIDKQTRLFQLGNKQDIIDEKALLSLQRHIILLGDVGAGKTTTLKRLIKTTFSILFHEPDSFPYSFPIVVKLGDIKEIETLYTHICKQLNISHHSAELKNEMGEVVGKELRIGNSPLEYSIARFLDELNCIIFLDGLDEVNSSIRGNVFNEIKNLSQLLLFSKIILTSRHIEEVGSFKQFINLQICPLTPEQKLSICKIWLEEPKAFLELLGELPYYDLSNRPLFLTYLIILFKSNNNHLPEKAIDIYRQIILLVIREWDSDKETEIVRHSKYRKFDTYKKEDFLSELTFELTLSFGVKKSFEDHQLISAYNRIYGKYPELAESDAIEIVKDIESINGLIIETRKNVFEFSHLSLQEYLCAKYVISIPFSKLHYELMYKFPSALSIANVLSPRPDEWFSMLILLSIGQKIHPIQVERLYEFLDRLILEHITFQNSSKEIGFAIFFLAATFENDRFQNKLCEFLKIKNVYESTNEALQYYSLKENNDDIVLSRNNRPNPTRLSIDLLDTTKFIITKKTAESIGLKLGKGGNRDIK